MELGKRNPDFGKHVSLPVVESYCDSSTYLDQYQCYGYLSMLAKYIEVTKDMTEEEMKLYLVRAEYRYFHYVNYSYYSISNSKCPLGKIKCL